MGGGTGYAGTLLTDHTPQTQPTPTLAQQLINPIKLEGPWVTFLARTVSDSSLEQVRDILNRHLSNMNRNQALNTDQIDYYQESLILLVLIYLLDRLVLQVVQGLMGERDPFGFNDPAAVTTTRSRPASSNTGAAQAPQENQV